MADHDSTLGSSPPNNQDQSSKGRSSLDLSAFPPIYLGATHFETEDLHEFEEELDQARAVLTYSVDEAEIVLSKAVKKARIKLDLRSKGLYTEEVQGLQTVPSLPSHDSAYASQPTPRKRRRDELEAVEQGKPDPILIEDSSTESEGENGHASRSREATTSARARVATSIVHKPESSLERIVKVVRTDWFNESRSAGQPLPIEKYVTYVGRRAAAETALPGSDVLQRAREDAPKSYPARDRFGHRKYHYPNTKTPSANPASWEAGHGTRSEYAHLLHETTTEHEGYSSDLPEPPEWVKAHVQYACQRLTPKDNFNDDFIDLLEEIKLARLLTNDEIGVRAYATSIAALRAYTHQISNPKEVLRLPGCDAKIANLWIEWKNTGKIKAVEDARGDEELKILKQFWNIWGVGVTTAREFYFDKGWREIDDIVEFGWSTLQRVQQIGVKYYDEFLDLIPRAEVESICKVIHRHAIKVRDDGIQSMIVGGYRRGKEACGDVDIVISHPDEAATHKIVEDIVASLEDEGWITHTLTLSLNNSKRGQQTLPYRSDGGGHGFDTLDKALVVWQDPTWPTKDADLAANPRAKNPNIHRRVDIIIAPWRTAGCAVVGWSGATTFERDLRRYAKNVKGWKFDSSGVRDRGSGEVLDLEGYYKYGDSEGAEGRAKTLEEAERRVFEGFGLPYRAPTERCTH
ncbi:hypothetical protein CERZMDRAFT_65507 [Cercospora zeae-maydis SCOH1-5]|uniref:DNA polymerase n=1 Tax=Cercospora zeae-maydis SCOH1-5 TaxID=717836 RepID=A0A6A6FNY3_9PEZI|nr:hypothetical protein CERZMDRAFT_65507 [Cercospora zeae-maydis SCOH1-5]